MPTINMAPAPETNPLTIGDPTMNLDTKTYAAGFVAAIAAVMLPVIASLTLVATAVPNVA